MKVALYSSAIREASCTHMQVPPHGFEYVTNYAKSPDVVMATGESAQWMLSDRVDDPAPKILWLQESRWLTLMRKSMLQEFDLVLSNDKKWVDLGAKYMTLFGTWITDLDCGLVKTELLSMIASAKENHGVEGYYVRREVKTVLGPDFAHGFGGLFGRILRLKEAGLGPYRFSVAVESEKYDWWHTEKLFDCFAARTVPLYWGCSDFSRLEAAGYDARGIIWFHDKEDLDSLLRNEIAEGLYDSLKPYVEHNYRVTRELYCAEAALMKEPAFAALVGAGNSVQR